MADTNDTSPKPYLVAVGDSAHRLDGVGSKLASLLKADVPLPGVTNRIELSRQSVLAGTQPRPINYDAARELARSSVHHKVCIDAKVNATVGLGHLSDAVNEELNEYALGSWMRALSAAVRDRLTYGNGYLEITRNADGEIRGIYHLPAKHVWVCVEDNLNTWHYEIQSPLGGLNGGVLGLRFAKFGDREDFIKRHGVPAELQPKISEVIHLGQNVGEESYWYGYPLWVPATKAMEVKQALAQYLFDFFFHGGVPDALLTVTGGQVTEGTWKKVVEELEKHRGVGNRRKLLALNIGGQNIEVGLHKLAMEGQAMGDNQPLDDAQALEIVTSHRVPPLLAGIQIPGKLGAANEVSNALMAFQSIVISQDQVLISRELANTLGNPQLNGGLKLTPEDFLGKEDEGQPEDEPGLLKREPGNGFRRIVDVLDMGSLDTMGRMKQSMAEAKASGRDLSAGVATREGDVAAGRGEKTTKPRRAA